MSALTTYKNLMNNVRKELEVLELGSNQIDTLIKEHYLGFWTENKEKAQKIVELAKSIGLISDYHTSNGNHGYPDSYLVSIRI